MRQRIRNARGTASVRARLRPEDVSITKRGERGRTGEDAKCIEDREGHTRNFGSLKEVWRGTGCASENENQAQRMTGRFQMRLPFWTVLQMWGLPLEATKQCKRESERKSVREYGRKYM